MPFAFRRQDQFKCPIMSCAALREKVAIYSQPAFTKPTLVNENVLTQGKNSVVWAYSQRVKQVQRVRQGNAMKKLYLTLLGASGLILTLNIQEQGSIYLISFAFIA
jgi:hypothetical protein